MSYIDFRMWLRLKWIAGVALVHHWALPTIKAQFFDKKYFDILNDGDVMVY